MKSNRTEFRPTVASAPGKTIAHILAERKLSRKSFAEQMGLRTSDVDQLLNGELQIDDATAVQLEITLGSSRTFWLRREQIYRKTVERLSEEKEWLRELPWRDMIEYKWIEPATRPREILDNCLRFFDVDDVNEWAQQYQGIAQSVAYRTTRTYASTDAAVAAWLRQGAIVAEKMSCNRWNSEGFLDQLEEIRALTKLKDPQLFIPALQESCARHGVAVVILRAPRGCRHSGVTRFITPDKALLLLSFRHLSDDHFWFTFFHEAGHLILHNTNLLFVEGPGMVETKEEAEANRFSSDILIPQEHREELRRLPAERFPVVRFARKLGISPGVVVGQMQHAGLIGHHQLNFLKRRYGWDTSRGS